MRDLNAQLASADAASIHSRGGGGGGCELSSSIFTNPPFLVFARSVVTKFGVERVEWLGGGRSLVKDGESFFSSKRFSLVWVWDLVSSPANRLKIVMKNGKSEEDSRNSRNEGKIVKMLDF